MTERTVPEGFNLKTCPTAASGHSYEVEALQADSLQAILDAYQAEGKNGEEILCSIWNAGNEQGAKQGQKDPVRKAVDAEDSTEESVASAVEKHQEVARGFIQGAPRGGGGARHASGLTKAQRTALGTAVATEFSTTGSGPTKGRMDDICKELGIDPGQLGS